MFNEFNGEATIINVIITVKITTFKTFLLTMFLLIIFKHILTYILLHRESILVVNKQHHNNPHVRLYGLIIDIETYLNILL